MTIKVWQARGICQRAGNGGGNGRTSPCIVNDDVPVFYCYVVAICYVLVKSVLNGRQSLANEGEGSGDL